MAIDVPVASGARARSWSFSSLAAIPARLVLTGIVGVSFVARLAACVQHTIPLYFPDEYIYSSIARSLAETGKPLVRGGPAHFPALLEPLLAAPFWLFHDPVLAYRLTQAEQSLAMALAAIPAYVLARKLGFGYGTGLACAALAVACPDLMYVSFVIADPIAYPLALAAVYAGVCALDRPTRRGQLAFLALAGLATFARVQYVFLPVAFVGAALVVERGRFRAAVRSVRLTLCLMALPLVGLVAMGPSRVLGYYSAIGRFHVGTSFFHWIGTDALLLAYAAGWILVPGAIVGVGLALARPASRAEAAFGGLVAVSTVALFVEAALYASNGSGRFQERYLFLLLPLAAPAFGLFVRRAHAGRKAVPIIALGMLLLSARIPLSGYTVADFKQDSPFLFAVYQLERATNEANGSLFVAILAAVLAAGAAVVALSPKRRALAAGALGATILVGIVASASATSFDNHNTQLIRASFLPGDLRWVDEAKLGPADILVTDGTPTERPLEQLFWNTSLKRILLVGHAQPIDAFASPRVNVAADGRMLVNGSPERRPLLVSSFATLAELSHVTRVRQGATFALYKPAGTPRLSVLAAGLYHDHWLAAAGRITVWPRATGRTHGMLTLRLSLPPGPGAMTIRLHARGVHRSITVQPGGETTVRFPVQGPGSWALHFRAADPGHLSDGRAITMQSSRPVFTSN